MQRHECLIPGASDYGLLLSLMLSGKRLLRASEVGFYPISTASSKGSCINSVLLFSHYQSKAPIQPHLIYSFIKDNCADFQFQFVEGCGKNSSAANRLQHNLSEVHGRPLDRTETC